MKISCLQNYLQKIGLIIILTSIFGIFSVSYLIVLYPYIYLYKKLALYAALILLFFTMFLGLTMFFDLPKQEIKIDKNNIIIKTKFLRLKEERIPLSFILRVYVNFDMSYKYYIRQSKTSEMLKTIVIFEKDGLRIMKFLDQNSISSFDKFMDKLISAGIKVVKIPLDIKSQKEFAEKTLHEEYLRCDRIE